ncbi:MAG: hypothetical protein OHK93_000244 [Ramalina farinacea]|uniref:DEK-C domain-containing protein n=1 Tax=Ramalina farinacea TaxID=258253 RepID=A0AA43QGB6_9LECA|nr:hypothetical protein [Ramalina farinacea]
MSVPSHAKLERALREAVRDVYKNGDLENLTVKRIRKAVQEKLALEEDFFKTNDHWKDESKSVIQSEVDAHDGADVDSQAEAASLNGQLSPARVPVSKSAAKAREAQLQRASPDSIASKPKKKRKLSPADGEEPKKQRLTAKPSVKHSQKPSKSAEAEADDEAASSRASSTMVEYHDGEAGDKVKESESEMSVVLDEDPKAPKKKRRRKSESKQSASGQAKTSKKSKSSEGPGDPDAEEIKRLQGWLIKCGIRKMWYKELAPHDGSKAKIKHLKEMLADAGMNGRYSKEKADSIREERELKADLEAVQQGEKAWGKAEEENDGPDGGAEGSRPKRRLAKGLQGLDFLNDDDGEETD